MRFLQNLICGDSTKGEILLIVIQLLQKNRKGNR